MKLREYRLYQLMLFALIVIGGFCIPQQRAYAATAVEVAAVEYYDDNIIVLNNGNSKIYYATDTDAANDKWECIDADAGLFTMIDISWLVPSSENVIIIKGDAVDTRSRVVIKQKPTRLEITINYTNMTNLSVNATIAPLLNVMSTEGTSDNPITYDDLEWRKGETGKWMSTDSLTVSMLEKFLVKGASLYFRIRAIDDCVTVKSGSTPIDLNDNRILGIDGGIREYENVSGITFGTDYPNGTQGRRFSDEVKLKIVKQAVTMVTGVDGEDFTAAIKYGKEYRVTVTYADSSQGVTDWVKVTDRSVKEISLETLANSVTPRKYDTSGNVITYNGATIAFPAMFIEIRDYATAKTAASKITEISLNAQRKLTKSVQSGQPSATGTYTADDIFMYYFGDKYVLLTIPMASAGQPYEYCIVKPGGSFNMERANWSVITKGTAVKLLASKAVQGGTIYIRQKEIKSREATNTSDAVAYQLASTYITQVIDYPSVPEVTKTSLTYVKSYSTSPTITVQLNESGKKAFEDTLTSVRLGTKEISFTTAISVSPTDSTIKIMTITLTNTDLEAMANCTNRLLTLTFGNGTVDKSSVKLTIKNPTAAGNLTLSAVAGATAGTSKVSVISSLGTGNTWVYVVGTTAASGINIEDTLPAGTGTTFTTGMEIAVTANQYITVYEIDANRNIIKYKSLQITAGMIK